VPVRGVRGRPQPRARRMAAAPRCAGQRSKQRFGKILSRGGLTGARLNPGRIDPRGRHNRGAGRCDPKALFQVSSTISSRAGLMTVARWAQNRSGREIAALAPLAASGCIILALTVAGPRVNAAFGSPGLVPLLITSGLATLVATKIAR